MKKIASWLNCLVMLFSLILTALPVVVHASGTINISNCNELQQVGSDLSHPLSGDYVVTANFSCADTVNWNSGAGFIPIGSFTDRFTGTFDGQNHTIDGLFIDRTNAGWPGRNNVGLFSVIDEGATVTNLNLTNVNISGDDDIGALAGGLVGHVENVNASGQVHGNEYVGGLVGQHVPVDNLNNSSPLVFTWNGQKYTYVADVGDQLPKELSGVDVAQIDSEALTPRDSKYSMKITQEYNEIVYYDELSLMTFDHAPGYNVVEPLNRTAGLNELRTVSKNPTNPLQSCTDSYGHDCKVDIQSYDNKWSYEDPSYDNCWVMDFGDLSPSRDTNVQLLMRGARDYAKTPATKQRSIQVKDTNGNWVEIYNKNDLGSDATPRLRSIDLTGKFRSNDYHVRVCLDTWRVNYFGIDTSAQVPFTAQTYHPSTADLNYHGFTKIDNTYYPNHDYDQVSDHPDEMLRTQYGNFTKYGDVKPLLNARDDHFVVMHYGDQLSVDFPYNAPTAGQERSFMLYNDVFYKHANLGTIGLVADSPMPYHGMTSFDANTQYPQTPSNLAYLSQWNTRHFDGTGRTGGSTIVNSTADVTVHGGWWTVGGMVGLNYKPIINSHAYGDVEGQYDVGGLVGRNASGTGTDGDISGSSASGNVTQPYDQSNTAYVGGLVGYLYGNASIDNSYATGNVHGGSQVGGLIGLDITSGHVRQSFATGSVHGAGNGVGGFVGDVDGSAISDSYATGSATTDQSYVGGFAGSVYNGADVERSYATGSATLTGSGQIAAGFAGEAAGNGLVLKDNFAAGAVSGSNSIAGFVASYVNAGVTFSNNVFDEHSTGQTDCTAAGSATGCTSVDSSSPATDVLKRSTNQPFATNGTPIWDFTTVWRLPSPINGGYACLRWQSDCTQSASQQMSSAQDSSPISFAVNGCSTISEWQTQKEDALAAPDSAFNYPKGFVKFHLNNCNVGGQVTINVTFTTNLTLNNVTVRKYNSVTHAYTTLTPSNSGLTVTSTTLAGSPALAVRYTITDGGLLDQDNQANGEVVDPVGIGVLTISSPNTGLASN